MYVIQYINNYKGSPYKLYVDKDGLVSAFTNALCISKKMAQICCNYLNEQSNCGRYIVVQLVPNER